MEKKIKPMEPTLETINLGNNEIPRLIKKLAKLWMKKKKKIFKNSSWNLQEVFAWSYKDMPRIDPEIAQYHIGIHDHMVPVK